MLILHTCCAQCLIKYLHSLKKSDSQSQTKHLKKVVVYYYNPNILPRSEYQLRLKTLQKILKSSEYLPDHDYQLELLIPNWRPVEYFQAIENINVESRHERCPQCWRLRLKQTIDFALQEYGSDFDEIFVSTTMLVSQYLDQEQIIKIGENLSKKKDINFYQPEKIIQFLKLSGFYKQNFCGCVYSLKEKNESKYAKVSGDFG